MKEGLEVREVGNGAAFGDADDGGGEEPLVGPDDQRLFITRKEKADQRFDLCGLSFQSFTPGKAKVTVTYSSQKQPWVLQKSHENRMKYTGFLLINTTSQ